MIRIDVERLILARKRRGWNQIKLAALMGVTPGTVSHIETNRNSCEETVKLYAEAVGVDMDDVYVTDEKKVKRA